MGPKLLIKEPVFDIDLGDFLVDTITKEKRSLIMSKIRSKNTKPEIYIRKFLFQRGFRYRLHSKNVPGTPDIVLPKYRTVIFINGCFWHGHDCKIGSGLRKPKSNVDYWRAKIAKNIERDKKNLVKLNLEGWNVIVIWECEIKDEKKIIEKLMPLIALKKDIISLKDIEMII